MGVLDSDCIENLMGRFEEERKADRIQNAIRHIKTSVQSDIIACGDCKHYIPHDKRCGYWNHGVQPLMWCSQAERRWMG